VGYGSAVRDAGDDLVFIMLTNKSAFPVRWTQAGMDLQDGSERFVLTGLGESAVEGYELPAVVPPGDSGQTAIRVAELLAAGLDLYRPLVAQARLATGQVVRSAPKTLVRRSEDASL
jgi:hypothetical protein